MNSFVFLHVLLFLSYHIICLGFDIILYRSVLCFVLFYTFYAACGASVLANKVLLWIFYAISNHFIPEAEGQFLTLVWQKQKKTAATAIDEILKETLLQ